MAIKRSENKVNHIVSETIASRIKRYLTLSFSTPIPRPKSGSLLLYSRKKVRYRRDGYCWKKRKDGKTTREDHMKLKVQGTEVSRRSSRTPCWVIRQLCCTTLVKRKSCWKKNLYGSRSSTGAAFNVVEEIRKLFFGFFQLDFAWVMIFRRKQSSFFLYPPHLCLSSANEISCCQGLSVFIRSVRGAALSCLGACCYHYKCIKTVGNFTPIFFCFPGNFLATFFS